MSAIRAFCFLVAYTLRRQLRSRKVVIGGVLLGLIAAVVVWTGLERTWSLASFSEIVVLRLLGLFYMPIVALMLGTAAVGDDRDERSLVYLLTRPISRGSLYVGKLLGVLPLVLLLNVGGFAALYAAASVHGRPDLEGALLALSQPILLGSFAYAAFFHLLAATFRHATVIAIAYVFFVEAFLGNVPGILKRVAISFYTSSMIYDGNPAIDRPRLLLPMERETAGWVLAGLAIGFTLLGAWVFGRREHREVV